MIIEKVKSECWVRELCGLVRFYFRDFKFIFINDYIVRKFDILLDEMFDKLFYFCISYVCRVNVV